MHGKLGENGYDGDTDTVFDALAAAQRRQVLVGLLDHEPQHVAKLSDAEREMADAHEAFLSQYLSDSRESAAVDKELLRTHFVHLPKLVEYGFAEWDRDTEIVTKGPQFDEIRPFLELLDDQRDDRNPAAVAVPLKR